MAKGTGIALQRNKRSKLGIHLDQEIKKTLALRVATIELHRVSCVEQDDGFECQVGFRTKDGEHESFSGAGNSIEDAIASAVSNFCLKPIEIQSIEKSFDAEEHQRFIVFAAETNRPNGRAGVGRFVSNSRGSLSKDEREVGLFVAALRAASHAGMLKAAYRANNQKTFRNWSSELVEELEEVFELSSDQAKHKLEAEGVVLEHMNRVASAAVVTAANYPRPDSILSLFDTSAWLFDGKGGRRDSYTDTDLWLAWYPGVENDKLEMNAVIDSMPQSPPTKIPWIVRLFENPESWIRFRGAVDLEDHDVMHVLLGRGLQDQDEAFVIGFAMGTAKKISWLQYWLFKFVIGRLYPEPYRIPKFLQPAFDLGVKCGKETGNKDLYKEPLKDLCKLSIGEARERAGIDMKVVRRYYEEEQQRIPFTIASLRLP